jgi:hypothetical protein
MAELVIHIDDELLIKAEKFFKSKGTDIETALIEFLLKTVDTPIETPETPSRFAELLGKYDGKIHIPDDFDEPMEEFTDNI